MSYGQPEHAGARNLAGSIAPALTTHPRAPRTFLAQPAPQQLLHLWMPYICRCKMPRPPSHPETTPPVYRPPTAGVDGSKGVLRARASVHLSAAQASNYCAVGDKSAPILCFRRGTREDLEPRHPLSPTGKWHNLVTPRKDFAEEGVAQW